MLTIVAVYGDIQGSTNAQTTATMVRSWNPESVMLVGDDYYEADGDIDNTIGKYYHDYISPYSGAYGAGSTTGNHIWSALGNHEYSQSPGAAAYRNFFTFPSSPANETYYQLNQGNTDWFFVDSNPENPDGNTVGSVQYNWLQSAMTASTATWKFVVFHHPAYSSADSPDATNMRWPFKDWGATAIFSGHHHVYERLNVNGLPYFISGLGGASIQGFGTIDPNSQFRYESQQGAMRLDIQPSSVKFDFFNRSGTLIDTYIVSAPAPPPAPTKLIAGAVSDVQIDLSWADNATTETNFILERSPDGTNNWAQISMPAANATTFSDTTVQPGLTYFYRVRASAGVQSANSNTASAATLPPGSVGIIPRGTQWKYLDIGSAPAAQGGATWRDIAYNDAAPTPWLSGRGQLGYGDGDETTIVSFGPNANSKYPTTYFRKAFNIADPAQVIQLDLSLLRDDGAVVYLNGTEIWRNNMPAGAITFTTPASSAIGAAEEPIWLGLSISPALLVAGNNVIAAEIHQDVPSSTDLTFDLTMTARMAAAIAAPSAFKATAVAFNQVSLKWIDTVVGEDGFKIERSIDGINFAQIGTAIAGATSYTDNTVTANKQYWYRARSYNASGDSRASSVSTCTTPVDPSTILPAPWSNGDIGAVAAAGSATHSSGAFTIKGSGADIGGTADEFHFVSQPWTGNGTIIARITGLTNTNAGAKAGIMFRDSTAAGAREVCLTVTPSSGLVAIGRTTANGASTSPSGAAGAATIWLKLVRNGNTFTPQFSTNGTSWTSMTDGTFTLNSSVLVGMCVTSKNDGVLATATFDNVSVTTSVSLTSATPPPDDDAAPAGPPGQDKWKKLKSSSLAELVGLKKDPMDALR